MHGKTYSLILWEESGIQIFADESSWKMTTWKTKKEMEGYINMNLRNIGYENSRWLEQVKNRVQWWCFALVLNLQVLLPETWMFSLSRTFYVPGEILTKSDNNALF